MSILRRAGTGFFLVIIGLVMAILLIEVGLRLIPEAYWKKAVSRIPSRHILYRQDPNIGWALMPNARMNWQGSGEYNVDVAINSVGLRDYERTYEKPADTFRILVLGDSFAEAVQVPLEQTFSAQLEKCLADRMSGRVEVLNAGVAGYGAGEELLFFTHEGVKFQPDLVLLAIFIGNDIRNAQHHFGSSFLDVTGGYDYYLQDGQLQMRWVDWYEPNYEIGFLERLLRRHSKIYYILVAPDSKVPHWREDLMEAWSALSTDDEEEQPESAEVDEPDSSSFTSDLSLMIFIKNFPDNPLVNPDLRRSWEIFKASIGQLKSQVDEHGAELGAIIIPRGQQVHEAMYGGWVAKYTGKYDGLRSEDWDLNAPNEATREFLQEYEIPTLDLLPGFQAYLQEHDDMLYFDRDGHFNGKGHEVSAALMCHWLTDSRLVPLAQTKNEN